MTELINLQKDDYDKFDVIRIDRKTQFGNPFKLKQHGGNYTRSESVKEYREWFSKKIEQEPEFRSAVDNLKGETLACHCVPEACHGHVILSYLEGEPYTSAVEQYIKNGGRVSDYINNNTIFDY